MTAHCATRANWRWLHIALMASILMTLLFWLIVPSGGRTGQGSDYRNIYEPAARSLLAGKGYATSGGSFLLRVPPGYPLFLAAVFWIAEQTRIPETTALHGAILLLTGLAAALILAIAQMVWRPLPALLSAATWLTCPFILWLTIQYNSDILFLPILYAAVFLFLHGMLSSSPSSNLFFCVGIAVGMGMLVRPIALGLGPVLALCLFVSGVHASLRLAARRAGILLLAVVVMVLPWEIWAYARTGKIIVLSSAGADSIRHGLTFGIASHPSEDSATVDRDVEDMMREIAQKAEGADSAGRLLAIFWRVSADQPWTAIKLLATKAARAWYGTDSTRHEVPILLIQCIYLPLALYASRRAWSSGTRGRVVTLTVWMLVLYFWAMTMLVAPLLRYMTPPMGLLFTLLPAAIRSKQQPEVLNPNEFP